MSKFFMEDTALRFLEQEMQKPPGFQPRRSGIYIMEEPLHDYEGMSYESIVDLVISNMQFRALQERVENIYAKRGIKEMFFRDSEHKKRFEKIAYEERRVPVQASAAYASAVFLLTADAFLWDEVKGAVAEEGIYFERMKIGGVDLDGYAIFHTAKDLYQGTKHIRLSELSDPELISDKLLCLIVNSFVIRRYGIAVIQRK